MSVRIAQGLEQFEGAVGAGGIDDDPFQFEIPRLRQDAVSRAGEEGAG